MAWRRLSDTCTRIIRAASDSAPVGKLTLYGADGRVAGELRLIRGTRLGAYMLQGGEDIYIRLSPREMAELMSNLRKAHKITHDTYLRNPEKRGSLLKHLEWTPDADGEAVTLRLREENVLNGTTREAVMHLDSAIQMIWREVVRKTLPELHGFRSQ